MAIFLIDRLNPFDNPLRLSSQRQPPVTIFRLCIVILLNSIDFRISGKTIYWKIILNIFAQYKEYH